MVKHVVMWKLKASAEGGDKASNARRIKAELEALRGKIPGLRSVEVGVNFDTTPAAWDVVLISEHDDEAALAAYQKHTEHVRVAEWIGKVREDRALVDFA